jgi:hypothetical protein
MMKLHCTLIALYAALALTGFASASNLLYDDGAHDANHNIVGGVEVRSCNRGNFLSFRVSMLLQLTSFALRTLSSLNPGC